MHIETNNPHAACGGASKWPVVHVGIQRQPHGLLNIFGWSGLCIGRLTSATALQRTFHVLVLEVFIGMALPCRLGLLARSLTGARPSRPQSVQMHPGNGCRVQTMWKIIAIDVIIALMMLVCACCVGHVGLCAATCQVPVSWIYIYVIYGGAQPE